MIEAASHRTRLTGFVLAAIFVLLAGRGGHLAFSGAPAAEAAATPVRTAPLRAEITDRHGERLAATIEAPSLWANPSVIWNGAEVAAALVTVFPELDEKRLAARLSNPERKFEWVKRGLTPRQQARVMELGVEGLAFRTERRRVYPRGALGGHLLGYVGIDGHGLGGLELALDDRLAAGGAPVRLTIDIETQSALEAELARAAAETKAIGAAAIVMATRTGEIRGLASWPPFDPNTADRLSKTDPARLNRAVGVAYELGSVFKPLTIAAALDAGAVSAGTRFDVSAPLKVADTWVRDLHSVRSPASLGRILAESSNIGTVRVNDALGTRRQQAFLETARLTSRVSAGLPGATHPIVPTSFDPVTAARVSFGHGISVSPLAFISAFAAFGNDGIRPEPILLLPDDGAAPPSGSRLISAETAAAVRAMLREAVVAGSGRRADVPGYRVAGKTGTAEKPVAGGYDKTRNVASFAAVFPADSPEYALIVTLDEPRAAGPDGATAGLNAAPAAGHIIERIAPLLGVVPRFEDIPDAGAPTGGRAVEGSGL